MVSAPTSAPSLVLASRPAGLGGRARRPWLWWNLLSADAPLVAWLWALLFARVARTPAPWVGISVLAACVWLVYALDRLLDGWRAVDPARLASRHRFCAAHRPAMLGGMGVVFAAALWLTCTRMSAAVVHAGLGLAAAVALYLVAVHAAGDRLAWRAPKEMAVGVIFAAGTALPAWARAPEAHARLVAPVVLFAVLCWLNCTAIECWEHHRSGRRWPQPPAAPTRLVDRRMRRIAGGIVVLSLAACAGPYASAGSRAAFVCCTLSGAAFALLDRHSHRLSPDALRVLADAALLTPALLLPLLRVAA